MSPNDCFELGYIIKKHGKKGELLVYLDSDSPNYYNKLTSVYIMIDGFLIPYLLKAINIKKNKAIVKFENINTSEDADYLLSKSIHLPLTMLPKLKKNQFYYHEIIGYNILDTQSGNIGIVQSVATSKAQDLLICHYQSKEFLIPVNDAFIIEADHETKILKVTLPNGLLDIYLD